VQLLDEEAASPKKEMSTQEYIDKYYDDLEQLEQTMKMKRQEIRLRAVGFEK
jgi:hypothetical protein